jgi:hypothetical protein
MLAWQDESSSAVIAIDIGRRIYIPPLLLKSSLYLPDNCPAEYT